MTGWVYFDEIEISDAGCGLAAMACRNVSRTKLGNLIVHLGPPVINPIIRLKTYLNIKVPQTRLSERPRG